MKFHPLVWQAVTRLTAGKTMGQCSEDLCDHVLEALATVSEVIEDEMEETVVGAPHVATVR